MRILVVSNYFPPDFQGGFEISASLICRSLVDAGHEVDVLTRENPAAPGDEDGTLRIHRILKTPYRHSDGERLPPKLRGWSAVNATFRNGAVNAPIVRRFAQAKPYDLALCFNLESVGTSIASELDRLGIPVLWSIGDYWIFERRQVGTTGILARLNRFFWSRRHVKRELDAPWRYVIFNCENVRNEYVQAQCLPERAFIVHRSCPPPSSVAPYRAGHRNRSFLIASQIRPHKGVHVAIEAARLLAADSGAPTDWNLVVYGAGDPAYQEQLETQIREAGLEGRVELRGRASRESVAEEMGRCLALLHPAIWNEPFGRVNIEAMAQGTPLIAGDSPSAREVATDEIAWLYDRFDPADLARRMKEVLLQPDEARRRIELGLQRYETLFRPEVELERMHRTIEEVVQAERVRRGRQSLPGDG